SVQAGRGVVFFFNTTTALNAVLAYAAAGGGVLIVATSLAFAAAAVREAPEIGYMRMAVVVGFVSFLVANILGVVMIVSGAVASRTNAGDGTAPAIAAYHSSVTLVAAHAAMMQGILLPIVAWLASHTAWTARLRTRIMTAACAGYASCAMVITVEDLLDVPLLAGTPASMAGTAIAAAAAAVLLAALLRIGYAVLHAARAGEASHAGLPGAHKQGST